MNYLSNKRHVTLTNKEVNNKLIVHWILTNGNELPRPNIIHVSCDVGFVA